MKYLYTFNVVEQWKNEEEEEGVSEWVDRRNVLLDFGQGSSLLQFKSLPSVIHQPGLLSYECFGSTTIFFFLRVIESSSVACVFQASDCSPDSPLHSIQLSYRQLHINKPTMGIVEVEAAKTP